MIEIAVTVLSGSVGAGIMAIVLAALQRRWKKKDGKDASHCLPGQRTESADD